MNSRAKLTPAEYHALMRLDFYAFIERCFLQLNPNQEFLPNWHIEVIAAMLEACRQGKIRRLIINVPPRHLKSICGSIALVAWILGHNPSAEVLCVSYAQDLSEKLARDCRTVMMSRWFRALFGDLISSSRQSVQEFKTKYEGCRRATFVGGVLTGFGADVIIIDDPLKPDEALSESQRKSVNEWYDNTLYSRLNSKDEGCIILIMQRLHEDDLVGHVLEQEQWEVVSLTAIAEQDESFLIETPYGPRRFTRTAGGILHPARESRRTLANIRRTIGEYNFAGQYQQAPAPAGGGLIDRDPPVLSLSRNWSGTGCTRSGSINPNMIRSCGFAPRPQLSRTASSSCRARRPGCPTTFMSSLPSPTPSTAIRPTRPRRHSPGSTWRRLNPRFSFSTARRLPARNTARAYP
jgi:hypothetical protein